MAYQIKCDDYILYDPRHEDLIVQNPKCNLEVNTVGEASFSIFADHPYYGQLRKLRSVFEILQDGEPIFRGRMTEDTKDFHNTKLVDLEGVMAYFNDSLVRPFTFPDDFLNDSDYITAAKSGNVVEFFLAWLINQHNAQVQKFQQFKLGKVTVSDPNNYLSRSSTDYMNTWEALKTKLFDSAIGGYLCIRYEEDGNYIDYLEDFEMLNAQRIEYGENLLDLSSESDASETYSVIIPLGKKMNEIDTSSSDQSRLTIAGLADGNITDDIVKEGEVLYSVSAVEQYGFICAPTAETTWDDVTDAKNLQTKGTEYLTQTAVKLVNTITIKAVDLHFSDDEIEAFRIYRYVYLWSKPHGQEDSLKLTKLEIDILNPQNTVITIGDTKLSLTDINAGNKQDATMKVESLREQYLSGVRKAFADDNSTVTVSGGLVTFKSGTVAIDSEYFKLSSTGILKASNAIISGEVTTVEGLYEAQLSSGALGLYYDGVLCGTVNTKYWSGASAAGISLRINEGGKYIMFSHPNSNYAAGFEIDYFLNHGWSSDYDEMHIFQTSARFLDDVFFDGTTQIESLVIRGTDGKRYLVTVNENGVVVGSEI